MHQIQRNNKHEELCSIHGNEKQFFCLQDNCMVDLCNLCLIFHREIHEESNSEALIEKKTEVLQTTKQNLKQLLWIYEKEQKKIDTAISQRDSIWQDMFQKVSEKFYQSKQFLESIIDSFIKELEEQLFQNYIYPAKQLALEDLLNPLKQLKFKKEKIDQLLQNLSKRKYENEIIKYAFNKDINKTSFDLEQKIDNLIYSGGKIQPNYDKINIDFQKEKLSEVYSTLQDFVQVNVNLKELLNQSFHQQSNKYDQITSQIDIQQISSQKEILSKKQSSKKLLSKKQSFKEFTPKKLFQQINQQDTNEILSNQNQLKSLNISTQNFFEEESLKIIHFFESKSKNLLFINLDQEKENIQNLINNESIEKIQFQKLKLDIDFNIPRHHTSIISPEGYIVLLGGLIAEQDKEINFLNSSYILDWENETLVELTPMNYRKAGASAIYTSFGILVVGGIFDDFQVSKKCELYDIENDVWKEIQSLNEPCMTSTLSLFQSDQVLKIGGKSDEENLCRTFEIYNFFNDSWIKLNIQDFCFYNLSSAVQINDYSIVVFGGVDSCNKIKSNLIYEINLQDIDNIQITQIDQNLPQKDGFASQQPIIDNNIILALQNISEDKINSIKNNNKKIICISNEKIINLN